MAEEKTAARQRPQPGGRRKSQAKYRQAAESRNVPAGLSLRQTAAKLLAAVIDKKTSLDGLLDNAGGHASYLAHEPRDRALLRALLQAALRHRGALILLLKSFLQKPLPAGAKAAEHILHIGAAQILYLDVPNHAALDLAVESAKRNPQARRFAPLINAVLRRIAAQAEQQGNIAADDISKIETQAPLWFAQMLKADYGAAKAAAILKAQTCPPPLDITVKAEPQKWAARFKAENDAEALILPFGAVRLSGAKSAVADLAGFAEGAWWVQNAAASLPARLLGAVKGKIIADLCAAPGGKTAQLAAAGARVTAVDISAARLKRLRQNMERLGLKVKTQQADIRHITESADFSPYDAALLDAPCSSTGTVRRHPDILWTKTAQDISALARLQAELLAASLKLVKSGGIILFCNCSLAKEEGEYLLAEFLRAHEGQARLAPFTAAEMESLLWQSSAASAAEKEQAARLLTKEGFLRTTPADLPNENAAFSGLDGFFAARLQKL